MNFDYIEKLFLKFKLINKTNEFQPTFLELSGYPHYENVCSNILAFFFDTSNPHNLKDLFIKSLVQSVFKDTVWEGNLETISISREYKADENKRIDLVIETLDSVFVIENKIFHWLHNDLQLYKRTIDRNYLDKNKVYLVLSIKKENVDNDFIAITYDEFFSKLKNNFGYYSINANNKYILYLFDFIKTIENLNKMNDVNSKMVDFFIENKNEIDELINEKTIIYKQLYNECNTILSLVSDEFPNFYKKWIWEKNTIVFDFKVGDRIIAIDCTVDLDKIDCDIFDRKGFGIYEILDELELIKNNSFEKNGRGYQLLTKESKFYQIDKVEIITFLEKILQQIIIK